MSFFKLPHEIFFKHYKTNEKLSSSYVLRKGDIILITRKKINFRFQGNKYFVIIKKFGNNDKIIDSFKKSMTKDFKIEASDYLNLELEKVPGQKIQISFELRPNKRLSFIDFQKGQLFLNHNRYRIKPRTSI